MTTLSIINDLSLSQKMRFFLYCATVLYVLIRLMIHAWEDDRRSYVAAIEEGYYSDGAPEVFYP